MFNFAPGQASLDMTGLRYQSILLDPQYPHVGPVIGVSNRTWDHLSPHLLQRDNLVFRLNNML